jgi:hypothetical protein
LTYELWEKGRGNLIELVSPGKTYTNLTIHHWDQAAGKHAQQDPTKAEILAQGVAAAINETPSDEQVLIIVRKQDDLSDPSLEQSILEKVGRNRERSTLHFLTWGRHTATNELADVKHVIVVGALQYSYAQNEALARAAEGLSVYASVTDDKVDRMRLGEIAHHLFQAVGRGAIRKSFERDCPPGCHLWIAVSSVGKAPHRSGAFEGHLPGRKMAAMDTRKARSKENSGRRSGCN